MGVEVAGTEAPEEKEPPVEKEDPVEKEALEKKVRVEKRQAPARKAIAEEKPYWMQHLDDGSADRSRTAAVLIISFILVILVLSAVLVVYLLQPHPRTVYSELAVGRLDVVYSPSTPSGDNRSALVPVEIKISNLGEGRSGVVKVFCDAVNYSNLNQKAGGFNTSELRDIDNKVYTTIAPKGEPGSIVRATGVLNLTPGKYSVRLEIFEDAGKRTLVSGSFIVNVDQSMVANAEPYIPVQDKGRGRATEAGTTGGLTPGFEGPAALAATAVVLVLVGLNRRTGEPGSR